MYSLLQTAIQQKKPLLIGRFGTIEMETVAWFTRYPLEKYPMAKKLVLERNAGVFPAEDLWIERWCDAYRSAIKTSDALAVGWWLAGLEEERRLLLLWHWDGKGTELRLRDLEPYYIPTPKDRWTSLLQNQKVCVVSSFTDTIQRQLAKGEEVIWPGAGGSLWPAGVQWSFVRTGYSPALAQGSAGWEDSPENWQEAVDCVVRQVLETGADIVLIGCGGLGMVIGERLKAAGKICIVMGGAIQVLFGVKGERWARHEIGQRFWGPGWVWPDADEIPGAAGDVEGACYWAAAATRSL
jgi:hypothetical protein